MQWLIIHPVLQVRRNGRELEALEDAVLAAVVHRQANELIALRRRVEALEGKESGHGAARP